MLDGTRDGLRAASSAGRTLAASGDEAPPGDRFVRDFLVRAERFVVPAMVEVGRRLEAQGRFFSIERIAERRTCRGVLVPTSVQMNVFRRHRTVNFKNGAPHFNVVCDRLERRVLFRRTITCIGAVPEDVGGCALDALTRERVRDGLLALLDELARLQSL